MTDDRIPMVFGKGAGKGTDAWFWAGADDDLPLPLQLGVWGGKLTVEQARELRDMRGAAWWNALDMRVVRKHLAEQKAAEKAGKPVSETAEILASLRQATAAFLAAEKEWNEADHPRHPAGDPRGGQFAPKDGAGELPDITTDDINAMRAEMGLPPLPQESDRKSTSRKIKDVGQGINSSILLEDENGTRWIWKPVRGAQDNNSEVAAYEIAQVLGMDCVPLTRYEVFGDELGTAQQYVDGLLGTEWTARNPDLTPLDVLGPAGVEDVVVLDAIIENQDRHTGNWIVGEDQKVWAIDNGGAGWGQGLNNEFGSLYYSTLVNRSGYWATRKPGKLRISPEKLERWSRITKEEFLSAFRDVPYRGTDVNPQAAWVNFQNIVKGGLVAWRDWNGPSALSLPSLTEA